MVQEYYLFELNVHYLFDALVAFIKQTQGHTLVVSSSKNGNKVTLPYKGEGLKAKRRSKSTVYFASSTLKRLRCYSSGGRRELTTPFVS